MRIITVNVNKGGAGKTTLSFNLAEFLASQNKRVLMLDFDDSTNLTNRYGQFDNQENTVVSLFENGFATPIHIHNNLDLIAGHKSVEQLKERLQNKRRREYLFGQYLAKHEEQLENNYDYVIVDTENDEGILTQNAIIVSDLVVGVAEASKDSFLALIALKKFVNELNEDFSTNAKLAFVANKINLSENASKDLLEDLSNYTEYVGYLPRRTKLADTTPIYLTNDLNLHDFAFALFDSIVHFGEEVSHG